MRQAMAFPGTASMQDASAPSTRPTDRHHQLRPQTNSDTTGLAGASDITETDLNNLICMLDDGDGDNDQDDYGFERSVFYIFYLWY